MTEKINLEHFKEKLLIRKKELIARLADIGRINPDNPADWEATPGDINNKSADKNKLADSIEEYEARTATLNELEDDFKSVNEALLKIEKGTYGFSEISGEPIETERLEAYPSAKTTIKEVRDSKKTL